MVSRPASFTDVDAADAAPLIQMMAATDRWDAVRAAREWVLDRAVTGPEAPVLDVGCGPGTFGARARRAGHRTIDVDRAAAMVGAARSGDPGAPGLVADTLALPFPDGVAGTVHCERVLQWTADPDVAVAELWRVTAPGGLLAVTDTDWATFAVDAPEGWVDDVLADAALGWVPHPRLAGTLVDRLTALGASAVEERRDHVLISAWDPDDPAQADGPPGLPLHSIAAGAGGVGRPRALAALDVLAAAARRGRFAARLTIVTAVARR